MNKEMLSETVVSWLLWGVRQAGTYDPDKVLGFIEENLTLEEYKQIEGFLRWITKTGQTFGHLTLEEKFTEYSRGVKCEQARSDTGV